MSSGRRNDEVRTRISLKYGNYMQILDIDSVNLHVGTLTIELDKAV